MGAGHGVGELCRDAYPRSLPANAALQDVAHAEIAAYLAHVDALALVLERGIAGDHEQLGEPRQLGNDILGDAVAEVVLALVATNVLERKHSYRRPVGQGQDRSRLFGLSRWRGGDPRRGLPPAPAAHKAQTLAR